MALVKGYMQTSLQAMTIEERCNPKPFNIDEPMQMWERLFAVCEDGRVLETTVDLTKRSNPHFDTKGRVWTVSTLTAEEASKFEYIGSYQMPILVK